MAMALEMTDRKPRLLRAAFFGSTLLALAGCDEGLDFDLRGNFGNGFDTSSAVREVSAPRPAPDDRGVISYPSYQVVVARSGDTIADIAARLGVDASELARYNGISPDTRLRNDEIIALPGRVTEPSPATGADGTGPILPAGQIDVESLAGDAIARTDAPATTTTAPATAGTPPGTERRTQSGEEPVRHKVERGETAYSVSRLYGVSVRA
ncbi:MAG: LysM peptidoglycan-binding domain-containing protein, partial [Halocynthiibacter sp.]